MKLFVTGGTGFLGANFLEKAKDRGHEVVALRRVNSESRLTCASGVVWHEGSLDDRMAGVFKGIDCFVHFAAHSVVGNQATLEECLYWNVLSSVRLINEAMECGVKKFLIAGSCFEYGLSANQQEKIHPASEMRPVTNYAISKASASTALIGMARVQKVKMKILRVFQAYGEGEKQPRLWPSLKAAALGGQDFLMTSGLQVRDFIHVNRVIDVFLEALDFSDVECALPQIRNVGTGVGLSVYEFASAWWRQFGATGRLIPCALPQRDGELSRIVADIDSVAVL
jgi:nucleoside-diphosphate-sugar epimerase